LKIVVALYTSFVLRVDCAGKGFYGDVFLAKAFGVNGGCDPERLVVVKSLLSRNELHQSEFYREAELFSRIEHEHVVRAVGLCRDAEPMFLITEYCEWVSINGTSVFYNSHNFPVCR
jgi:PTK7 protein tyrosine kinase 7